MYSRPESLLSFSCPELELCEWDEASKDGSGMPCFNKSTYMITSAAWSVLFQHINRFCWRYYIKLSAEHKICKNFKLNKEAQKKLVYQIAGNKMLPENDISIFSVNNILYMLLVRGEARNFKWQKNYDIRADTNTILCSINANSFQDTKHFNTI